MLKFAKSFMTLQTNNEELKTLTVDSKEEEYNTIQYQEGVGWVAMETIKKLLL